MIGLGGNLPETLSALGSARALLAGLLWEARFSSLYRTAPQMDTDQEFFWNAAAVGEWPSTAESLLERLLMMEAGAGRIRSTSRPKGPRLLDLDLLAFGTRVRSSARLTLPHPRISDRRFVLEPLLELEPMANDPLMGVRWDQIIKTLPFQGVDRTDRTW